MLLILYGTASELGRKCRDYLQSKGYEIVDKYSYAEEKPLFESRFGQRIYLPRDEFYKKTDSLFRYNVSNFQVGFNWEQISDAVYENKNKNKLLTCTSADVSMLRKIKEVFEEKVKIIYCHIDTSALEGLFVNLPDMNSEEYGSRMAMGWSIKDCYSKNTDLFDAAIIYNGEGSVFDYETIYRQLDAVIGKWKKADGEKVAENKNYDICITAAQKDCSYSKHNNHAEFIEDTVAALNCRGISVFNPYKDLKSGDNFCETVTSAICRASVFLPIISKNSYKSKSFETELEIAVKAAKNSALIIYPITLDGAALPDCLSGYSAYNVRSESYGGSLNFIEDWFVAMFTGESTLRKLSEEIDVCVKTGLLERAFELQGSYVTTLHNHLSMWRTEGTAEKVNAWVRFLDMAVQINEFERGGTIVNSLLSDITDSLDVCFYDNITRCIVQYCLALDLFAEDMYERFYKFLDISSSNQQKFFASFDEQYKTLRRKQDVLANEAADTELSDKIAAYSNASVELFEALFENGLAAGYRETLISAYNRIIDYCKTVSLGNPIAEKCIDRISDLRSSAVTNVDETETGKKTLHSLKVYLGQALPDTGCYDVFISHKSEDDKLADKVYDYLKNCGFEVFCDHHTLGELHDSNYDKRVMEALAKSKHLILVSSSPDYVKNGWVHDEWHHFHSDKREKYRNGNLIMILSDDLLLRKSELPIELRDGYEIIKTSEFRRRINNYLW